MSRSTGAGAVRAVDIEDFVAQHYRRVVGSVALISGSRAGAEDAVQSALVTAWERRDEPIDKLVAWVTVVASNEARMRHRRAGAESRALERVGAPTDDGVASSEPIDPELVEALSDLPDREREAVVLHYVHDISVADTADAMGVTPGTVKTLLSRGRAHLVAALGEADT